MTHSQDTTTSLSGLNIGGDHAPIPTYTPIRNHSGGISLSPSVPPLTLTLSVGGRPFKVRFSTLASGSDYFKKMALRWTWEPEADGTYFIDSDPDNFEHILQFMRQPGIYPLFWDAVRGFDYDLYNRVQAEAVFSQIWVLEKWTKEKKYLKAIKTTMAYPLTRRLDSIYGSTWAANKSEDWHVMQRTRKVYLCPRGISVHRGLPESCGMACARVQEGHPVEREDETYLEVVSVEKEVVFDQGVCRVPTEQE